MGPQPIQEITLWKKTLDLWEYLTSVATTVLQLPAIWRQYSAAVVVNSQIYTDWQSMAKSPHENRSPDKGLCSSSNTDGEFAKKLEIYFFITHHERRDKLISTIALFRGFSEPQRVRLHRSMCIIKKTKKTLELAKNLRIKENQHYCKHTHLRRMQNQLPAWLTWHEVWGKL